MKEPPGTAAFPRRRRWWRLLLRLGVVLVVLALLLSGLIWWAFATNYPGKQITLWWNDHQKGVSALTVGAVVVESKNRVALCEVSLAPKAGAAPLFTARRIVASGELLLGQVDHISIEGARLDLTADLARFLKRVIDQETDTPSTGVPQRRHLDISGDAYIDGELVGSGAQVHLEQYGPQITGPGEITLDGRPFRIDIKAEGDGEDSHHRFTVQTGTGPVSVHTVLRRLVALRLLPAVPDEAFRWIPDLVDLNGSAVIADRHWRTFTGEARVAWPDGRLSGALTIDRIQRRVRLEHTALAAERTLGTLDGTVTVEFPEHENVVTVIADHWRPGPLVPLPAMVPAETILTALPQAEFIARNTEHLWQLSLRLTGPGAGQASLSWKPDEPLVIEGDKLPLPLLQPFLPSALTLAAGHAAHLRVAIGKRLENLHAEVEQTRVLWKGWALGTVDATVDLHPLETGYDLVVDLQNLQAEQKRRLGRIAWQGTGTEGELTLHVDELDALMARLKIPTTVLPELKGALDIRAALTMDATGVRGRLLERTRIVGGVLAKIDSVDGGRTAGDGTSLVPNASRVSEMLHRLDATVEGPFTVGSSGIDAALQGRITQGEWKLADHWVDLARQKPVFSSHLQVADGALRITQLLMRATDDRGATLTDGYSAGLEATCAFAPLQIQANGVIDHADLGWLAGLLPQTEHRLHGEGAVTFTARIDEHGQRVEGWFLPLGATLDLGTSFRATGLTGAVQFLLATSAADKR